METTTLIIIYLVGVLINLLGFLWYFHEEGCDSFLQLFWVLYFSFASYIFLILFLILLIGIEIYEKTKDINLNKKIF